MFHPSGVRTVVGAKINGMLLDYPKHQVIWSIKKEGEEQYGAEVIFQCANQSQLLAYNRDVIGLFVYSVSAAHDEKKQQLAIQLRPDLMDSRKEVLLSFDCREARVSMKGFQEQTTFWLDNQNAA